MKPLHQITLPLNDNAGAALTEAHAKFSRAIVSEAGGCTTFDASGQWLTDTGHVQAEPVRCYQVACDLEQWRSIVQLAKVLFPDQQAIFHATIGTARIEDGLAAKLPEGVTAISLDNPATLHDTIRKAVGE